MRSFRQLDQEQFQQVVSYTWEQLLQSKEHHVADLAQAYFNTLWETLEIHAPAKTVTLRRANPSPWYNEDVDEARHKRHQMEHIWRRTKLEIHRQLPSLLPLPRPRSSIVGKSRSLLTENLCLGLLYLAGQ